MREHDVVVTGTGAVTPVGDDADETWSSVLARESGAGPVTHFDADEYEHCPDLACEVDLDPYDREGLDERSVGRYAALAVRATAEVLDEAGLDPAAGAVDCDRIGTSLGSGIGGMPEEEAGTLDLHAGDRLSPWYTVSVLPNVAAGHVSIEFDARGPNRAQSTACAAGAHAIADAIDDIRLGRADAMIAGGTEAAICPTGLGGFGAMRALSTRTDEPTAASRPFDADRDGFVVAEGAGVLLLERRDHALERGAPILAEATGRGLAADAEHPSRPPEDAHGLARAIDASLADARLDPDDVDLVNAHATSTPRGDVHECQALQSAFETVPPVTAPKSVVGHALGAAGGIESVLAVRTLATGTVTPTTNCEALDPDCDVPVVEEPRETHPECVLSNSAGFGGTNAALVFEAT